MTMKSTVGTLLYCSPDVISGKATRLLLWHRTGFVCVCVSPPVSKGSTFVTKSFECRGVRRDCGTALNEATTITGYRV